MSFVDAFASFPRKNTQEIIPRAFLQARKRMAGKAIPLQAIPTCAISSPTG